ncbi:TetR/AcrR family transcriptional regulator C-terminal domain-containing protein [Streptomyces xiaopingdaonensis]|uniref:TetR/AcrR family transcriptional regulator C-terminal domain-containing protein n=1 Tax=Streptomyces xiaopingdaonensis TaxID=1565415 RepID=UPI000380C198|nr:TetR/AcrR family transcriptional regulator C-terminal domain-containing protein [Streptomyces xiaopingdaonensis]
MQDQGELPSGVAAAWGLRPRRPKGPVPGLSVERIVAAAVAVADAEGLAAVSMGRVAKEVGASTMALYRYVAAKQDLYLLMHDAAAGPPPEEPASGGWREKLEAWAWGLREVAVRRPWTLRIPVESPPLGPNGVAWMEQGLRRLGGTPLGQGERLAVLTVLDAYVRGQVRVMADIAAAAGRPGESAGQGADSSMMGWYTDMLRRVTDAERFPALTALLRSGELEQPAGTPDEAGPQDDAAADFAHGVGLLLDGVERAVARASAED